MASSKKKRVIDENTNAEEVEPLDESNESSDDDVTDESENEFMNQEVQVEFEARMPEDSDFNGIKTLLQQLFLKTTINLSELSDIIISQNYVGSVFKQVDVEEDDDDDNAMDDDSDDTVFGIVTAINLMEKKDKECVQQLMSMVISRCQESTPELAGNITEILHNLNEPVGLLLNERFINIPPQITVPAFQSLRADIEKACRKKMAFNFTYWLMLCKTYRFKAKPKAGVPELFYSNPEEELIAEMSDLIATWSVAAERDGVSDGRWDTDDMEATRTVLLFRADKLSAIIDKLKAELAKT